MQPTHAAQVRKTERRFHLVLRPSKCSKKCSTGPGWSEESGAGLVSGGVRVTLLGRYRAAERVALIAQRAARSWFGFEPFNGEVLWVRACEFRKLAQQG